MKNMLEYKGYHAKIEFDKEDMLMVGSVFGIQDVLAFHGTNIQEIVDNFHQSIDNYLEMCAEFGRNPDKEFKGSFNVRIDPELHRQAALEADRSGMTLNQYVEKAIRLAVSKNDNGPIYITTPVVTHVLPQTNNNWQVISDYGKTNIEYVQERRLS